MVAFEGLKVHVLCFKIQFSVSFELSSHQRCKFKSSVERSSRMDVQSSFCILQFPISYCVSLIMQ